MVATCDCLEGNSQPPRLQRGTEENDSAVSSALTHIQSFSKKPASSSTRPVMSSFFCLSVFKALPVTWPGVHIERVHAFVFSFTSVSLYGWATAVSWAQCYHWDKHKNGYTKREIILTYRSLFLFILQLKFSGQTCVKSYTHTKEILYFFFFCILFAWIQ